MNARTKITLDRIFAKPFAFVLNPLVFSLGRILRINHRDDPKTVKVIAIAKLLGMGSILRATPLIKTLKKKYPSAKYLIITSNKNKKLVERLGLFDDYLYIREDSLSHLFLDFIMLLLKLWKERIDLYFDLEVYSAFSTILATFSLSKNRYGFYNDSTSFRLGMHTHLVYFNDQKNIGQIYLQFAKACGIESNVFENIITRPEIRETDKEALEKLLQDCSVPSTKRFITINPNASDLMLERRWPSDYFISLIDALALDNRFVFFLIGSKQEWAYNEKILNGLTETAKKTTYNTAKSSTLNADIYLISRSDLMITNDSGLYHISVALRIPTISLWGPCQPNHYGYMHNDRDYSFYNKDVYCSPCIYKTDFPPCRGDNVCMKSILPEEVYEKCCELLDLRKIAVSFPQGQNVTGKVDDFDITIRMPK